MTLEPKAVSVFDFAEPVPFLRAVLEEKKRRGRGFSLRAWSRQLGFRTPSYLSAVLKGDRRLKPELATRLCRNLQLQGSDAERFDLLVLRANAKGPTERFLYDRLLQRVRPSRRRHRLNRDRFALIADWYHLVLLEMIELPDFRPESAYLSHRLGGLRPELVDEALRRLQRLGLAQRRPDGSWARVEGEALAGDDMPSAEIRAHHRQFLEKAKRALETQACEERDVRGSTFRFAPERMEEARTLIRELHQNLRDLSSEEGEEVYRFGSQLFRLTEPF